jgi:hypothetical protein
MPSSLQLHPERAGAWGFYEPGALFDNRDERALPLVDDGREREEPSVDGVYPEREPRHVIDEDLLRLRELLLAAEVGRDGPRVGRGVNASFVRPSMARVPILRSFSLRSFRPCFVWFELPSGAPPADFLPLAVGRSEQRPLTSGHLKRICCARGYGILGSASLKRGSHGAR